MKFSLPLGWILLPLMAIMTLTGGRALAQDETVFDSDLFDQVEADEISFDEQNNAQFNGNVVLKGELNVRCNSLSVISAKDQIVAKGSPVEIEQQDIEASCRLFEYNMKTKGAKLTGDPIIYQKREGGTLVTQGDIITITSKDNGKVSLNVDMKEGSNRRPTVKFVPDEKKKKDDGEKGTPAMKIESPDILKLPATE